MIINKSFFSHIIPMRGGRVALLKYGNHGYMPIFGRCADGKDFIDVLRRLLTDDFGTSAASLADDVVEIPVPYLFQHASLKSSPCCGIHTQEHHFYIAHVPDDMELDFCEDRAEDISVAWLTPNELLDPKITLPDDWREFYAAHILPNLNCRFSMSMQHQYYEMLTSGDKDIELRLYDEKRQKMRNGDTVLIYDAQNRTEYVRCKIVRMHIAKSFADLTQKISISRTGFTSLGALTSAVSKFYNSDQESKYGIVGIELEIVE